MDSRNLSPAKSIHFRRTGKILPLFVNPHAACAGQHCWQVNAAVSIFVKRANPTRLRHGVITFQVSAITEFPCGVNRVQATADRCSAHCLVGLAVKTRGFRRSKSATEFFFNAPTGRVFR